jgi:MoxR-like ATPase
VGYPERAEEKEILRRVGLSTLPALQPQASGQDILEARASLADVYVDDKLQEYVLDVVSATRRPKEFGLALDTLIAFGASPRATLAFSEASRAVAFLRGRGYVVPEDVKEIAKDVLRHRILLTYEAEAENITTETIVDRVLERVEVP